MKKLIIPILVTSLTLSSFAADETVKTGTIPGAAASIGIDLAASKSEWQKTKEHFKRNWGKYLLGLGATTTVGLVGQNNNWFHDKDKGSTSTSTSSLHDEGITINVSGTGNSVHVDRASHNEAAEKISKKGK